MPDLTKADVPSFLGGGSASSPRGYFSKFWGIMLGIALAAFAVAAGLAVAVRAIRTTNRQTGMGLSLPAAMTPAGGNGGGGGGVWEAV